MAVEKTSALQETLSETLTSSPHMEQKTFIETSCFSNIHTTGGKRFLQLLKKTCVYFSLHEFFPHFLRRQ